jgi:OOP family OmpA-OmpF porin
VTLLLPVLMLAASAGTAEARRYHVSLNGEMATLTGGDSPDFWIRPAFGLSAGFDLNESWAMDLSFHLYDLYDDSTISSSFSFSGDKADATRRFKATRLEAAVNRDLLAPAWWLSLRGGLGGGLMIWEMQDPDADTVLHTTGSRGEEIDFSSTEIFLSGQLGLRFDISHNWALDWGAHADYLTGAGTDFADAVADSRDRWLLGTSARLVFSFGSSGSGWVSTEAWSEVPPVRERTPARGIDSDGDGVPDADDDCPNTPSGVAVDSRGCSGDSDGDGVLDGLDHCPGTDLRARGKVDIFGCAVDSDYDGIPDYLDDCPSNAIGAQVDSVGCPLDDDADGVPNGLDDCPNTLYGVDVDRNGCIDLSFLDEPMVLNIDYPPGSFEVDPNSQDRLRRLARVLLFVKDVRLEISGYTDNIGTDAANQALSEKRANRVRDFLAAQGVDESRMTVYGRGETKFVASNQTAEGRAQNRRIEIVFYK